ncbi:hypothetical protein CABS01_10247 [Colletotrichum abscissum]|nr:uncharacterized protein CABS01_10247 [Colletotrichum abscissum]KAK1499849.1 hypothetical protein CABS01_10247 [Colletotrichum abscissum]
MPIVRITALGIWGVCHEIWMWLMLPTSSGPAFCDTIVRPSGHCQ